MSSDLPRAFWSSRVLVVLNVIAVATSLTSCTGAVMPFLFEGGAFFLTIFGGQLLWVMLSRLEATFLGTRWAWLACVPIGYLNCAMTIFMMTGRKDALSERIVMSLVLSVPMAIVWVPALLVGLALYGVPMELSRGWSKSGLAWRDRGEALVGAVSAGLAVIALIRVWFIASRAPHVLDGSDTSDTSTAVPRIGAIAVFAIVAGGVAVLLVGLRARQRRAFLRSAAAGDAPGYRVEIGATATRLFRVRAADDGYRSAAVEEEVYGEAAPRARALPRGAL